MSDYYHCFEYTKSTGKKVKHYLIKTPLRTGKNGKKYHKTNNCFVCRENGIRKQTTYVCSKCNIAVCYPTLTERVGAPTDCFLKFHERSQVKNMFSYESSDEDSNSTGTNDTGTDDFTDMI